MIIKKQYMIENDNQVCNTFLIASGKKLRLMKEKVRAIMNNPNPREKPYKINYKKVVKDYKELCYIGCLDEFLINYCWGYFMFNPSFDSPINREAYFLELKDYLKKIDAMDILLNSN